MAKYKSLNEKTKAKVVVADKAQAASVTVPCGKLYNAREMQFTSENLSIITK